MDQRISHPSLPKEEKAPEPEKKIQFTSDSSGLVSNHKRHLTDPKVAVISIPK